MITESEKLIETGKGFNDRKWILTTTATHSPGIWGSCPKNVKYVVFTCH